MTQPSVWAVVPVKPFDVAKLRLASVLDAGERAHLARLMLEDVLTVLAACSHLLKGTIVSTADADAADLARDCGAIVIHEETPSGLNEAIRLAIDWLGDTPGDGLLVVPADLPHVSVEAVARLVNLIEQPRTVAMIPAPGDGGTNVLACRPAGLIPPLFGPQSFWRHREAARHAGIKAAIETSAELGHDIDRPDDLVAFLSMGTSTRTHAYLAGLGIPERLAQGVQPLSRGITSRAIVSI